MDKMACLAGSANGWAILIGAGGLENRGRLRAHGGEQIGQ